MIDYQAEIAEFRAAADRLVARLDALVRQTEYLRELNRADPDEQAPRPEVLRDTPI